MSSGEIFTSIISELSQNNINISQIKNNLNYFIAAAEFSKYSTQMSKSYNDINNKISQKIEILTANVKATPENFFNGFLIKSIHHLERSRKYQGEIARIIIIDFV